jgi:tryptophan-rich sensory protein
MPNYIKLIFSLILCQLAGFIGSFFTRDSIGWYYTLIKPSFRPPNWLFGPVWIVLYLLMGIALYLIWKREFKSSESKYPMIIFTIQLVLNASWSIVFFGARSIGGGLIVISALWILIFLTILSFQKVNKTASYLLIPYIIWVSYASILNFSIWRLN